MIKLKTMDKKEQIKEQAKKFLDDRYENAKIWQTVSIVELMADFHLSQTSELSDEWIREWGAKYYNDCMESDWTDMTPEDHFNAGAAFYRTHHSQAPQLTEDKKECCKICGHEVIECDIFCEVCNERRFIKKG